MSEKKITRTKTPSIKTTKETPLSKILTSDKQLSGDKSRLQLFLTLANFFEEDLENNILASSFELDSKYRTYNVSAWVDFKDFVPVRNYIEKFIREMQYSEAIKTTVREGMSRTKDAMDMQREINAARESENNQNILVFLIPQKNYTKVDD